MNAVSRSEADRLLSVAGPLPRRSLPHGGTARRAKGAT